MGNFSAKYELLSNQEGKRNRHVRIPVKSTCVYLLNLRERDQIARMQIHIAPLRNGRIQLLTKISANCSLQVGIDMYFYTFPPQKCNFHISARL